MKNRVGALIRHDMTVAELPLDFAQNEVNFKYSRTRRYIRRTRHALNLLPTVSTSFETSLANECPSAALPGFWLITIRTICPHPNHSTRSSTIAQSITPSAHQEPYCDATAQIDSWSRPDDFVRGYAVLESADGGDVLRWKREYGLVRGDGRDFSRSTFRPGWTAGRSECPGVKTFPYILERVLTLSRNRYPNVKRGDRSKTRSRHFAGLIPSYRLEPYGRKLSMTVIGEFLFEVYCLHSICAK